MDVFVVTTTIVVAIFRPKWSHK